MAPSLTIVWLVIHTTTFHGNGVTVQSVRAVQAQSLAECTRTIEILAAKPTHPGKTEIRICTETKPAWWIETREAGS